MLARMDLAAGDVGDEVFASSYLLNWNPPHWEDPNVVISCVFTLLVVLPEIPKLFRLYFKFDKSTFLCFWAREIGAARLLLSETIKRFWCEICLFFFIGFARSWFAACTSSCLDLSNVSICLYEFKFYSSSGFPGEMSSLPRCTKVRLSLNFSVFWWLAKSQLAVTLTTCFGIFVLWCFSSICNSSHWCLSLFFESGDLMT